MKNIDWKKSNGLVPAIVQDENSGSVLMLGYMNKEALAKTTKTKKVWFYSRSKQRLWMKGEVSKNVLNLGEMKSDCDGDTVLIKASPAGPTCHTDAYSCFKEEKNIDELVDLFAIIKDRQVKLPKGSYTTSLFQAGLDKILLKVSEESMEVVQAAQKQTKQRLIEETVDLLYHVLVLLAQKNIALGDIKKEVRKRKS